MGFFGDLFNCASKSYEKSKQAREYLRRAEELVEEGNRIYQQAYEKVSYYAGETEYRLLKHMDFKKSIIKELNGNVAITLKGFKDFKIDSRVIELPSISSKSLDLDLNTINSSISHFIKNPNDIISTSILNMFISDDDYYSAKNKRDEARMYKEDMKRERERLNFYKEKMTEIRSFMDTEKNELNILMTKVRQMTNELKNGMQKETYNQQEADYLKAIYKIAEDLSELLSTEFLGDTFYINQRYVKSFESIKKINDNLPSSPSINDMNTLVIIRKILGGNL